MAIFSFPLIPDFADADPAGIVHFSRFAVFVERAEHAWLMRNGFRIDTRDVECPQWPRVAFQAEYIRAVRPFTRMQVRLQDATVKQRSITWQWTIDQEKDDTTCVRGTMKTVCCGWKNGAMSSIDIPDDLRILLSD